MRGSTKIAGLFKEVCLKNIGKGRSKKIHERRNYALIYRYYYYSKFTKMSYDLIIDNLSREFYLSQVTVAELLTDNYDVLRVVKKENPSIKFMKHNYPYYNWSLKEVEFINNK